MENRLEVVEKEIEGGEILGISNLKVERNVECNGTMGDKLHFLQNHHPMLTNS